MAYDDTQIARWDWLGLNASGNFDDRSGNGFDLTPNGFVGDDSELVDGQYGQAVSIVPNKYLGHLLQAGDALDFLFSHSYELWFRRTGGFGVTSGLIGKTIGNLGTDISSKIQIRNNDTMQFHLGDGTAFNSVFGIAQITDTNLHHVVGTYDMATAILYVDGEEDNSAAVPFGSLLSCVGFNFEIGRLPNTAVQFLTAAFEEVRVHRRVMGASEVHTNFKKGPNRT